MPQRIVRNVSVVTKDGECNISLTLDINVNVNNGTITVDPTAKVVEEAKKEETEWAIPQFTSQKVKFGKQSN